MEVKQPDLGTLAATIVGKADKSERDGSTSSSQPRSTDSCESSAEALSASTSAIPRSTSRPKLRVAVSSEIRQSSSQPTSPTNLSVSPQSHSSYVVSSAGSEQDLKKGVSRSIRSKIRPPTSTGALDKVSIPKSTSLSQVAARSIRSNNAINRSVPTSRSTLSIERLFSHGDSSSAVSSSAPSSAGTASTSLTDLPPPPIDHLHPILLVPRGHDGLAVSASSDAIVPNTATIAKRSGLQSQTSVSSSAGSSNNLPTSSLSSGAITPPLVPSSTPLAAASSKEPLKQREKKNSGTLKKGIKKMRSMFSASSPTLMAEDFPASQPPSNAKPSESTSTLPGPKPSARTDNSAPSEPVPDVIDSVQVAVYYDYETEPLEMAFDVSVAGKTHLTTEAAIERIVEYFGCMPVPSSLYYYDPKLPGLRMETKPQQSLDLLMQSHHEWRLIPDDHLYTLTVEMPTDHRQQTIQYRRGLTVTDAVGQLMEVFGLSKAVKFNLFVNAAVGFWLDEKRFLSDYDFKPSDKVELRSNTDHLFIRVHIPELDTRFVVKSPPHFTPPEFASLLMYSLQTKSLHLENPETQYEFWLPNEHCWLPEGDTMGQHSNLLVLREAMAPALEFRLHHQLLDVHATTLGPLTSGTRAHLSVAEDATLHDVDQLLLLDNPVGLDDQVVIATAAGEELNPLQNVWETLRQNSSKAELKQRPRLRLVQVTTSIDRNVPSARVGMELDFSQPLAQLVPVIARRLGIQPQHVRHFWINEMPNASPDSPILPNSVTNQVEQLIDSLDAKPEPLVLDRPLQELNLRPLDILLVELNESVWRSDGKKLLDVWEAAEATNAANATAGGAQASRPLSRVYGDSIWFEGPDVPGQNVVLDKDSKLVGATLNKLIEKMTVDTVKQFGEYTSFVQTFFLTYHSFTTPQEVLKKLIDRYHVPRFGHQSLQQYDKQRLNVQSRVCNVIKLWTKSYTTCFIDTNSGHQLVEAVLSFTENVMAHDKQYTLGKQIRRNLFKLSTSVVESTRRHHDVPVPLPKIPRGMIRITSLYVCDPEEVARQLCLSEYLVYRRIKPTELLNQAWMKSDGQMRAPNIWVLSQRFNSMAQWVAKGILSIRDVQQRAIRTEWFVDVASYLFELKNFLSLMAVLAGINSASVSRLKVTKSRLSARSRKKLSELENIMHPQASYSKYRELYRTPNPEGQANGRIPFITVHLTDLVGIEDGNPDMLPGTQLINVAKRRLVYDVIHDVLQYQDEEYRFAQVAEMQRQIAFCYLPVDLTEEQLFQWSLAIEPRGWDGASPLPEPNLGHHQAQQRVVSTSVADSPQSESSSSQPPSPIVGSVKSVTRSAAMQL